MRATTPSILYKAPAAGLSDPPYQKIVAGCQGANANDEPWTEADAFTTLADDITEVLYGDRSVKATVVGDGVTGEPSVVLPFSHTLRDGLTLWIKVDDVSKLNAVRIYVHGKYGGTSPSVGYYWNTLYASGANYWGLTNDTWTAFYVPRAMLTKVGDIDTWDEDNPLILSKFRFRIVTQGDSTVNVHFGLVTAEAFPRAGIVLGFDGVYESIHDVALPDMLSRGWKGVGWQVVDGIDQAGFCTQAQLEALYAAGWDIASHGWDGTIFNGGSATADVRADLAKSSKKLRELGFYRGSHFHSWMGNAGLSAVDGDTGEYAGDLVARYFLAGRGSVERVNYDRNAALSTNIPGPWIPYSWYDIHFFGASSGSQTDFTHTFQGKIDQAIADRTVLDVYIHKILASPGANDISTGVWAALLAYLDPLVYHSDRNPSGTIEIITMSQWYDRIVGRPGAVRFGYEGRQRALDGGGTSKLAL